VFDIATDRGDGMWVLSDNDDHALTLSHIDCRARTDRRLILTIDVRRPAQLGTLRHGAVLVVLGADGRLTFVDARTGRDTRSSTAWRSGPCWVVDRMATDGDATIVLLCHEKGVAERCVLFVLDAEGDVADRIPIASRRACPADIAVGAQVLWLSAADGVWSIDASDTSGARESESVLLTPALLSPPDGRSRGWLRAEIDVDLPAGAVIEAEVMTAGTDAVARQATVIAGDTSRTAAERRRDIGLLFDRSKARLFHFTTVPGPGQPIAIPLFDRQDQWLWLQLRVVTPPGVTPFAIRALRVRYPDTALMQYVPAVYRGSQNDPTGFFRSLVGVLEATTDSIDARIRAIGGSIDPDTAPEFWLDTAARWLGLPWEDALPEPAKRRLMQNAGLLLEARGTRTGLERLLRAITGDGAVIAVADLTVDHRPRRLGSGAALPMLLAGPPAAAPILNRRAVLGRACLGTPCDPLRPLAPTIAIDVDGPRAARRTLEVPLQRIVSQYVPAGVGVVLRWRSIAAALGSDDDRDGYVLDGTGPGRLGDDSEIGRVVLGGRAGAVDGLGLDVGFPLA
jgi:phage tail-like protein